MKTTSYNTEKEIRFGILMVVFAIAIFTTIKVQELQLNEEYNEEITSTNQMVINHANYLSLPKLDARLIEEPALVIETWMMSNTYFTGANAEETVEAEPTLEIESWMTTNTYFTGANAEETVEAELALEIESWMSNNNFWSGNTEDKEKELTSDIESWMNSGTYWTGSEKQVKEGNNLANN